MFLRRWSIVVLCFLYKNMDMSISTDQLIYCPIILVVSLWSCVGGTCLRYGISKAVRCVCLIVDSFGRWYCNEYFLDVTFDLSTGTYKPFKKPNDHPIYINTKSNHPPNFMKQIPISVKKRISVISSSNDVFDNAAPYYNEALWSSGYSETIQFQTTTAQDNPPGNRNRKGNTIWFYPPFSMNVSTNVARKFPHLTDKHFPQNHKFHKIFNRHNVKVSYSCMPNITSTIRSHNKKILSNETPEIKDCNCRDKSNCPSARKMSNGKHTVQSECEEQHWQSRSQLYRTNRKLIQGPPLQI